MIIKILLAKIALYYVLYKWGKWYQREVLNDSSRVAGT
jgi:hypothetical protein